MSEVLGRGAGAAQEGAKGLVCVKWGSKLKFPKRTQIGSVNERFTRASVWAQTAVQQAAGNPEDGADDVSSPVVKVCAAIETGLYEFNGHAESGRPNEDGQQPEAARTGEWEDQRGKGNEVDDLVAPLRRWGRRLKRPKHRDSQSDGHDEGHGYVEVPAHAVGVPAPNFEGKRRPIWRACCQVEIGDRSVARASDEGQGWRR